MEGNGRGGGTFLKLCVEREKVQRATINCAPYDVRNTKALTEHFSLYFLGLLSYSISFFSPTLLLPFSFSC